MTTDLDPEQEMDGAPEHAGAAAHDAEPERRGVLPERPPRQRRPRPEPNPALDPRLVQLERSSRRPSKAGDASLLIIGIAAFIFGVAMHGWVAMSILDDNGTAESSNDPVVATATTAPDEEAVTPTPPPQATPTPLPDRTSCEEIRGTQYRSVTEREFFLANCTGPG